MLGKGRSLEPCNSMPDQAKYNSGEVASEDLRKQSSFHWKNIQFCYLATPHNYLYYNFSLLCDLISFLKFILYKYHFLNLFYIPDSFPSLLSSYSLHFPTYTPPIRSHSIFIHNGTGLPWSLKEA